MVSTTVATALETVSKRNSALAAIYTDAARSILSRSVSKLALSVADQRRELGKALVELAQVEGAGLANAEVEQIPLDQSPTWAGGEICDFLQFMVKAESAEYELLSSLAGAFVVFSADGAERLASLSEQARKRATWAQDHLDLLGICP